MTGGDENARRAYRLGSEVLARVVDDPRHNPRPLVERADSTADLDRSSNRRRRHLGRLAVSSLVVFPQLAGLLCQLDDERITVSMSIMEGGLTT